MAGALTGGHGDTVMVGGQPKHVIGYMRDFLFAPEQARTPLGVLSGGERGRLMLARALAKPSNVLVLDEPTNDLDLETLDVLEEMLGDYAGTVLLISHDRDFLDRVVNAVIAPEGGGRLVEYAGGYSDMLAQRGADFAREPAKPSAQKELREAKAGAGRAEAGQAAAELPREARARDAAQNDRRAASRHSRARHAPRRSRPLCARPEIVRCHLGRAHGRARGTGGGGGAMAGARNVAGRARGRMTFSVVIPGRGLQPASPESITTGCDYGFRARAHSASKDIRADAVNALLARAPRNDGGGTPRSWKRLN